MSNHVFVLIFLGDRRHRRLLKNSFTVHALNGLDNNRINRTNIFNSIYAIEKQKRYDMIKFSIVNI